jgi:hypothetical protein
MLEGSATIDWAERGVLLIWTTLMTRVCLPELWRHVAAVLGMSLKPRSTVWIVFSSPAIQDDMSLIFPSSDLAMLENS